MKTLRPLLGASLRVVPIAALLAAWLVHARPDAAPAAAPAASAPSASIATVPARRAAIARSVPAYGSVDFASNDLTVLNLPYAARVQRLAVSAGQALRKGMLLAELDADPAIVAAYVQAESTLAAARDELKRTQSLYDNQLATQSQLAVAQKAAADGQTALDELRRQGAVPGTRRLLAPFDGVAVIVNVAQGDRVAAGAPLLQIGRDAASGTLHASVGIDPAQAASVQVGDPVGVVAMLGANSTRAEASAGRVLAVRRAINPQTRLVDVSIALDRGAAMLPGTPVLASIEVERGTHWVVPRSAVLRDAKGDYLYQVDAGRARRIAVSRQADQGNDYGVDGPLVAGRPVVALGNYELDDGMAVREAAQ